jgi:hypothetical protein
MEQQTFDLFKDIVYDTNRRPYSKKMRHEMQEFLRQNGKYLKTKTQKLDLANISEIYKFIISEVIADGFNYVRVVLALSVAKVFITQKSKNYSDFDFKGIKENVSDQCGKYLAKHLSLWQLKVGGWLLFKKTIQAFCRIRLLHIVINKC